MLVALINKPKQGEQKPDSPITVDLSQTKPARKQSVKKSTAAKKEKIITDNTAELKATIDRIFADEDAILITTQEQLLDFLRQQEVFGLDTETTGLYFYKDKIAGFSLGTATRSAYIPLNHTKGENYKDDLDIMCEILLERRYYGFNAQFDWHFLEKFKPQLRGLELAGEGSIALRCYDITLPHRLKEVYREVIDPTYEEYSFTKLFKGKAFTEYDPKDVFKYAAVDARKHYVVTEYFENKLRSEMPQVYERYRRIELRVLKPLYETEKYGMCLDRALVQQRYDELEAKKVPLLEKTKELSGDPNFNPGSPKQVREAFARFGVYLNSTNEEALASLDNPLAKAILDYREAIKLQGTYTTNLFEFTDVDAEGNTIIHPSFDSMGADTSRMSSRNPNMQNFPRDNAYRNILCARPGRKLISVDYSQQEVRIIAALAKDEVMIDAFKSGKDFYALMASIVFNLPYEQCGKHGVNGDKRNQMKAVVLGLNYSMGIRSLASDLKVSEAEAQQIVNSFYKVCPRIHAFQKECLEFAKTHGYNETYFGHRRYYKGLGYKALGKARFELFGPGLSQPGVSAEDIMGRLYNLANDRPRLKQFIEDLKAPANKKETKHLAIYVNDREGLAFGEERQCTNSVIQGTAAEMTKLAAIVVQNDEYLHSLDAHIVNYIHDEILLEAPEAVAEQAGNYLADLMNDVCADMLDGLPGGAEPAIFEHWSKE